MKHRILQSLRFLTTNPLTGRPITPVQVLLQSESRAETVFITVFSLFGLVLLGLIVQVAPDWLKLSVFAYVTVVCVLRYMRR